MRLLLVAVMLLQVLAIETAAGQELPATRTVRVGQIEMRVRVAGLDNRAPGMPVVVLEAGAGQALETWDPVFQGIAAFAPVIAYDRSGLGQSQFDGVTPTPLHAAANLRELLRALRADAPFVLVGHSWGGPLIRQFAGEYAQDVAGLVYLDPMDWETTIDDRRRIFISAGGTAEQFEESIQMPAMPSSAPAGSRAELEVITLGNAAALKSVSAKPVPDVPQAVLLPAPARNRAAPSSPAPNRSSAQTAPAGGPPANLDQAKWNAELRALKAAHAQQWATAARGGLFAIVTGATHYVHRSQPRLVVEAIRQVFEAARLSR